MVEAAIVLPVLLLITISVIYMLLYFFSALKTQIEVQERALDTGSTSGSIFRIVRERDETKRSIPGILDRNATKTYQTNHYVINMVEAIRLGKTITGE